MLHTWISHAEKLETDIYKVADWKSDSLDCDYFYFISWGFHLHNKTNEQKNL